MTDQKEYSSEEIARHNNEHDLWIVIHGNVYDLTKFLKEHPGGEEVLLTLAGRDGTQCFDDIGHSQEAIQLRDTFLIGRLVGDSPIVEQAPGPKVAETPTIDDDNWEYKERKKESSGLMPIFIALGVAIYAMVIYFIFW